MVQYTSGGLGYCTLQAVQYAVHCRWCSTLLAVQCTEHCRRWSVLYTAGDAVYCTLHRPTSHLPASAAGSSDPRGSVQVMEPYLSNPSMMDGNMTNMTVGDHMDIRHSFRLRLEAWCKAK